jgi:predicted Zn-ribbon and HTH transcriptional regulator
MDRRHPVSPERNETARAELRDALRAAPEPATIRELSQTLGISERDLYDHLEHLARSLPHADERLSVDPARCLGCGYAFEDRTRLKKPGKCPSCKSTRIAPARFRIAPAST